MLSWVAPDSLIWQMSHIHILKGIFFIGVTGAGLFYFVQNLYQRMIAKERDLAQLFDHNPQPLMIIDAGTLVIVECNDALRYALQALPSDLIGKDFPGLFLSDYRPGLIGQLRQQKISHSFRKLGNWPSQLKSGKILTFQLDIVRVERAGTERLMISFANLTPQLQAERDLKELSHFIEQKIVQRTSHLERLNEELAFRARETEKVNAELIFINERLQNMARETNSAEPKPIAFSASQTKERSPGASV
jgi:PAS domain-containing protein